MNAFDGSRQPVLEAVPPHHFVDSRRLLHTALQQHALHRGASGFEHQHVVDVLLDGLVHFVVLREFEVHVRRALHHGELQVVPEEADADSSAEAVTPTSATDRRNG